MVTCVAKGVPVIPVSCFVFCTCFGFVCLFVFGHKTLIIVCIGFCKHQLLYLQQHCQEISRANPISGKSSVMTFGMTPKTREFSFY